MPHHPIAKNLEAFMDQAKDKIRGLIEGYRQTALIALACQTGIIDRIDSGCQTVNQLAIQGNWPKSIVTRILRGFVLLGLIESTPSTDAENESAFALTELGELLTIRKGGPERLYSLLSMDHYVAGWMTISSALTENQSPFLKAFGMPVWELRKMNPLAGELFNSWLSEQTIDYVEPIVEAIDLCGLKTVVDVGGGVGSLLRAVLQRYPELYGILADQAEVVRAAKEFQTNSMFGGRFESVAIDFFESVPSSYDAYLLKSVLHDWEDEECKRILRAIAVAMRPDAKLFIVERLIPNDPNADPSTIWLDLHMLCITGGKERTQKEFTELLHSSGLSLASITKTDSPFYVLEAFPTRLG